MSESLGARLRQRRERQHIALATISEQTKIKVSLLEELERDDISHWPVGIFRRAFIRSYAHAIGLQPNDVLHEFLALHPDADGLPIDPLDALADGARTHARPPTRLRFLVGSALSSLSKGREAVSDKRGSTLNLTFDAGCDPIQEKLIETVEPAATQSFEVLENTVEDAVSEAAAAPTAVSPPVIAPAPFEPDLLATARLCMELSQADTTCAVESLLPETARILDAAGLIVWISDPQAAGLRPVMAHGYPSKMLAQLPTVPKDADNATAAAFRSAQTCVVKSGDRANGAVVIPLMTPGGCAGVLTVELKDGRERTEPVHALATIVAAQLARLMPDERSAEASSRKLA
jgi:transcriptional regulator with XRE-family HTH domain